MFENFSYWVSGYYNHPNLASRSIHGLNFDKRGELPNPDDPQSTGRVCSIDNFTAEEMKDNVSTYIGHNMHIFNQIR